MAKLTTTKNKAGVTKQRIPELDFLRGIAFIFMVWDHAVYDLEEFFGFDVSALGFFKENIGRISAVLFMTLCGISVTLGRKNLAHAAQVFALAMALTVGTLVFDRLTGNEVAIKFGILHFLGISMAIGHFAKKLPVSFLGVLAISSLALGIWFESMTVQSGWLFPLGLMKLGFYSSDYYPLFPNLFYSFIGIIIGKTLYKTKKSIFDLKVKKSFLCFLGRHTLILYFAHQPVVIGIIFAVTKIFGIR